MASSSQVRDDQDDQRNFVPPKLSGLKAFFRPSADLERLESMRNQVYPRRVFSQPEDNGSESASIVSDADSSTQPTPDDLKQQRNELIGRQRRNAHIKLAIPLLLLTGLVFFNPIVACAVYLIAATFFGGSAYFSLGAARQEEGVKYVLEREEEMESRVVRRSQSESSEESHRSDPPNIVDEPLSGAGPKAKKWKPVEAVEAWHMLLPRRLQTDGPPPFLGKKRTVSKYPFVNKTMEFLKRHILFMGTFLGNPYDARQRIEYTQPLLTEYMEEATLLKKPPSGDKKLAEAINGSLHKIEGAIICGNDPLSGLLEWVLPSEQPLPYPCLASLAMEKIQKNIGTTEELYYFRALMQKIFSTWNANKKALETLCELFDTHSLDRDSNKGKGLEDFIPENDLNSDFKTRAVRLHTVFSRGFNSHLELLKDLSPLWLTFISETHQLRDHSASSSTSENLAEPVITKLQAEEFSYTRVVLFENIKDRLNTSPDQEVRRTIGGLIDKSLEYIPPFMASLLLPIIKNKLLVMQDLKSQTQAPYAKWLKNIPKAFKTDLLQRLNSKDTAIYLTTDISDEAKQKRKADKNVIEMLRACSTPKFLCLLFIEDTFAPLSSMTEEEKKLEEQKIEIIEEDQQAFPGVLQSALSHSQGETITALQRWAKSQIKNIYTALKQLRKTEEKSSDQRAALDRLQTLAISSVEACTIPPNSTFERPIKAEYSDETTRFQIALNRLVGTFATKVSIGFDEQKSLRNIGESIENFHKFFSYTQAQLWEAIFRGHLMQKIVADIVRKLADVSPDSTVAKNQALLQKFIASIIFSCPIQFTTEEDALIQKSGDRYVTWQRKILHFLNTIQLFTDLSFSLEDLIKFGRLELHDDQKRCDIFSVFFSSSEEHSEAKNQLQRLYADTYLAKTLRKALGQMEARMIAMDSSASRAPEGGARKYDIPIRFLKKAHGFLIKLQCIRTLTGNKKYAEGLIFAFVFREYMSEEPQQHLKKHPCFSTLLKIEDAIATFVNKTAEIGEKDNFSDKDKTDDFRLFARAIFEDLDLASFENANEFEKFAFQQSFFIRQINRDFPEIYKLWADSPSNAGNILDVFASSSNEFDLALASLLWEADGRINARRDSTSLLTLTDTANRCSILCAAQPQPPTSNPQPQPQALALGLSHQ